MNCIEFEKAFELAVEQRTPPDPVVLEHVRQCAECQQAWELYQTLESAIAAWRYVEPPAHLVDGVMQSLGGSPLSVCADDLSLVAQQPLAKPAVHSASANTPIRERSQGMAIFSMSACLLIAVVFFVQSAQHPSINVVQRATKGAANSDSAVDLPGTLTAVLSDLKSEYRGMAVETTAAAREMVSAIPRPDAVPVLPSAEEFPLQEAPEEMTRILKPIRHQVSSALGFLWQTVPSEIPSG